MLWGSNYAVYINIKVGFDIKLKPFPPPRLS